MLMKIIIVAVAFSAICQGAQIKRGNGNRIVGGARYNITKAPYQVLLLDGGYSFCGGSILNTNHIITAGHCVEDFLKKHGVKYTRGQKVRLTRADGFTILAGTEDQNKGGEEYDVLDVRVHPQFDYWALDYDSAILTLSKNIALDNTKQIVPLATEEPPAGAKALFTGWGTRSETGDMTQYLYGVEVPIITRKECAEDYEGDIDITDRMLCAGTVEGGIGSCYGDSGGPIVVNNKLVGTVSGATGCARPNLPDFFANIPFLRNWIEQNS